MSDLISRLSELRSQYSCFDENERDAYHTLSEAIEALKLASNLHQTCISDAKGHWIIFPPFIEEICMCSNCKTKFKEAYQHRDTCPSCGAKMKAGE